MEDFDNILVQRFNDGEEQAFNEVYKLYFPTLCLYARKYSMDKQEAEDIVTEVFVRLYRLVQTGKRFERPVHIRNFLFSISRNAIINHIHHKKRQSGYQKDFMKTMFQPEDDFSGHVLETELLRLIYEAVENLPPVCRKVFKMKYLKELGYQEIAQELKLSPQTIRNQNARAIILLRKRISKSNSLAVAGFSLAVMAFACSFFAYALSAMR